MCYRVIKRLGVGGEACKLMWQMNNVVVLVFFIYGFHNLREFGLDESKVEKSPM